MREKADFLKECMTDPALTKAGPMPLDLFNRSYCVVCANRECSRSGLGSASFDVRATNWRKDMFDSIPRADEADPEYARIREKNFLTVDRGVPEVSMTTAPSPAQRFEVSIHEAPGPAPKDEVPPSPEVRPEPQTQSAVVQPRTPGPESENTPFVQGTVLPGGPPRPDQSKDTVLSPGGTFTFGGSDE